MNIKFFFPTSSFFWILLNGSKYCYVELLDIGLMVREYSPMARETWVQSQVKSYQRLKKMVLDASLLSTQHHKVWIKGKVGQSWERSSILPYIFV